MNGKLRIGVIGLGMGRGHIKGYQEDGRAEVVALCDINESRLKAGAAEFKVPEVYTDAREMFDKACLHAVSIATPNSLHAPLTLEAFRRGLHVLCEKPMAMTVKESEQMLAASRKAKRNLMINFSFRFSEMSFALKQQVDAGAIGDVYFGRTFWHRRRGIPYGSGWFGDKTLSGGGPLIDLGVHRLDLALWLMGYPEPVSVMGSAYNEIAKRTLPKTHVYTVEDLACGLIRFDNGATLILEASWAANVPEREMMATMLCGTKGGLTQKNLDGGYKFQAEVYTEEDGHLFTKRLDWSTLKVPSAYSEFISSILEKRPPLADGEQGLKVMKILEGIYRSAETGREVRYRA